MFDAAAAIVRRKLTGRSIYATDRGHIHHVLLTRGMSATQAVALITGLCIVTSAGAMISLYFDLEWIGVAVVIAVIGLLAATRVFGHVEFLLVNARLFGFGRHLSPLAKSNGAGVRNATLSIQGSRQWEGLWGELVESADRFRIVKMQLNLSLPRLHEEFFATWSRDGRHQKELLWDFEIPLVIDEVPVGRMCVSGYTARRFGLLRDERGAGLRGNVRISISGSDPSTGSILQRLARRTQHRQRGVDPSLARCESGCRTDARMSQSTQASRNAAAIALRPSALSSKIGVAGGKRSDAPPMIAGAHCVQPPPPTSKSSLAKYDGRLVN